MAFDREHFISDYFNSWRVQKYYKKACKKCYSYEIKTNRKKPFFDQYGFIQDTFHYITIDELTNLYYDKVPKVTDYYKYIKTLESRMLHPDVMIARYPHIHMAYAGCDTSSSNRTLEYYKKLFFKNNKQPQPSDIIKWTKVEYPKIYHTKFKWSYITKQAELVLKAYGMEDLIENIVQNKIVFFTGSGISQQSGIDTLQDSNGIWSKYTSDMVLSKHAWESDPLFVNDFYNQLRLKYVEIDDDGNYGIKPNKAHRHIAELSIKNSNKSNLTRNNHVTIITQNIDDLHERSFEEVNLNVFKDTYKEELKNIYKHTLTDINVYVQPIEVIDEQILENIKNRILEDIPILEDMCVRALKDIDKSSFNDINKDTLRGIYNNFIDDLEKNDNDTNKHTLTDIDIYTLENQYDTILDNILKKLESDVNKKPIIYKIYSSYYKQVKSYCNCGCVTNQDSYDLSKDSEDENWLKPQEYKNLDINLIHLHGEIMKMCIDGYYDFIPTNGTAQRIYYRDLPKYQIKFPYKGRFTLPPETTLGEILPDEHSSNLKEKIMRQHVIFFDEDVNQIHTAINTVLNCDVLVIVGTSLSVYPAVEILDFVPSHIPIVYIDTNPQPIKNKNVTIIQKDAITGIEEFINNIDKYLK